jgi:hypothetical protein
MGEISGNVLSTIIGYYMGADCPLFDIYWAPFLMRKPESNVFASVKASIEKVCFHWLLPCFFSIFLRQSVIPPGGLKCLALFYMAASYSNIIYVKGVILDSALVLLKPPVVPLL